MLVIMSWQRYNILLEKAKKFIFFSNHFDSDISVRIEVKANHRTSRSERYGCPGWQRYNILLEKAKKFIFFSNHFDSDISVRIEVKANHRTSRSERYGCPASRQPRSFPSDHRRRGFHRDGCSPA